MKKNNGFMLCLSVVLSCQVIFAETVTEEFNYDPLGRITTVKEDAKIKSGYCYDKAGNRLLVQDGEYDCSKSKALLPRPLLSSVQTHQGGGFTISWSAVIGAACYKVKYVDSHYQTIYLTSVGTQPGQNASWIQACHEEGCQTGNSCLGDKTYL